MALSQSLQQKQLLKLLPQQIQLMKLLQVPTANLEERIKEELEENPALELKEEDTPDKDADDLENFDEAQNDDTSDTEGEEIVDDYDSLDLGEYTADDDDDIADYKLKDENYPEFDDKQVIPIKMETSFHELLVDQLGMLELDERLQKVAEQVVGSIDDDGYLRREIESIVDDLAFRQNIITTEKEVKDLIAQIKNFDPPGVGAANLQECLLLQLKRLRDDGANVDIAIVVMEKYFDEFSKKHYDKIQQRLNITEADMRQVINHIIKLNPKPGGHAGNSNKTESFMIPDFFIYNNNGDLELSLNNRNSPELRISDGYKDMLRSYEQGAKKDKRQKEAVNFIKQKIDGAKWFIEIIKQRYDTLYNTMLAIMMHQQQFFLTGDETNLRPMILKDIAAVTGQDISTVSRVANSKFVQTEYGSFRLKYFFNESMSTDTGEEVSTHEVKKILSEFIEGEDKQKPLSDELLTDLLNKKGYNIARRTVAKYREQLNFPVARLRKEL